MIFLFFFAFAYFENLFSKYAPSKNWLSKQFSELGCSLKISLTLSFLSINAFRIHFLRWDEVVLKVWHGSERFCLNSQEISRSEEVSSTRAWRSFNAPFCLLPLLSIIAVRIQKHPQSYSECNQVHLYDVICEFFCFLLNVSWM